MTTDNRLAIVTGASRGIGYELARIASRHHYDLLIAAQNAPLLEDAASHLREQGVGVETVAADLAVMEEVDRLVDAVKDRPIDLLFANAGHGLGNAFLDQDFKHIRHVVDTNITGTIYLIHRVGRLMREQGYGRILITGSIAGAMPAPFHAVYHATKAFIDNFSSALRNELEDTGVSVTCLMPGATDTNFFARAGLEDAAIVDQATDDPADVAQTGWDAMIRGDDHVVHGVKNKLQVAFANVAPASVVASQNRKQNEPGSRS